MKAISKFILWVVVYAVIAAIIAGLFIYFYQTSDFFRTLFTGETKAVLPQEVVTPEALKEAAQVAQQTNESASKLSFSILVMILILQAFAFLTALIVFSGLSHSREQLKIRLAKLENADIFLDLPLYFGLLGTVSSFIVMSFNPNISRLIAYSSTLVGIIFSVILRLSLHYPLKQRMTCELALMEQLNRKDKEFSE